MDNLHMCAVDSYILSKRIQNMALTTLSIAISVVFQIVLQVKLINHTKKKFYT